jgi:hypothetical protein
MAKSKFTPGPWRVEKSSNFQSTHRVKAGKVFLCAAVGGLDSGNENGTNPEETKANAELMADAPRMLEVLREIHDLGIPFEHGEKTKKAREAFWATKDLLEKHGG